MYTDIMKFNPQLFFRSLRNITTYARSTDERAMQIIRNLGKNLLFILTKGLTVDCNRANYKPDDMISLPQGSCPSGISFRTSADVVSEPFIFIALFLVLNALNTVLHVFSCKNAVYLNNYAECRSLCITGQTSGCFIWAK